MDTTAERQWVDAAIGGDAHAFGHLVRRYMGPMCAISLSQLRAGGFDRQVYKVNADAWTLKAVTGRLADQYDLLIGKWSFGVVEDVNAMFHTRADGKGQLNLFNYSNPEVDEILTRYDVASTDAEAQDAYHELHAILAKDLPYLFLWTLDTRSAWREEVRNTIIAPYFYFTEFDGWSLSE